MRIAVIGSGISGLSAAYFLGKNHEVTIFEKSNRLGGHTHTHQLELENKIKIIGSGLHNLIIEKKHLFYVRI